MPNPPFRKTIATFGKWMLILPIRVYQLAISPLIGNHCRFTPTCSQYAEEAIRTHGILRGGRLSCMRILRCHPWGGKGHDPVPFSMHDHDIQR